MAARPTKPRTDTVKDYAKSYQFMERTLCMSDEQILIEINAINKAIEENKDTKYIYQIERSAMLSELNRRMNLEYGMHKPYTGEDKDRFDALVILMDDNQIVDEIMALDNDIFRDVEAGRYFRLNEFFVPRESFRNELIRRKQQSEH